MPHRHRRRIAHMQTVDLASDSDTDRTYRYKRTANTRDARVLQQHHAPRRRASAAKDARLWAHQDHGRPRSTPWSLDASSTQAHPDADAPGQHVARRPPAHVAG